MVQNQRSIVVKFQYVFLEIIVVIDLQIFQSVGQKPEAHFEDVDQFLFDLFAPFYEFADMVVDQITSLKEIRIGEFVASIW